MSLWFWFAFPWWLVMLSILSCTRWPSACLLWKSVSSDPLPIFLLTIEFMNSSYIQDINPLWHLWFANIFPHSVGSRLLLHFVDDFFCFAKAFEFDVISLAIVTISYIKLSLFKLPCVFSLLSGSGLIHSGCRHMVTLKNKNVKFQSQSPISQMGLWD